MRTLNRAQWRAYYRAIRNHARRGTLAEMIQRWQADHPVTIVARQLIGAGT